MIDLSFAMILAKDKKSVELVDFNDRGYSRLGIEVFVLHNDNHGFLCTQATVLVYSQDPWVAHRKLPE